MMVPEKSAPLGEISTELLNSQTEADVIPATPLPPPAPFVDFRLGLTGVCSATEVVIAVLVFFTVQAPTHFPFPLFDNGLLELDTRQVKLNQLLHNQQVVGNFGWGLKK